MPTSFNLYFYVVVEMAACKSESGSGIVQLALAKLSPTAEPFNILQRPCVYSLQLSIHATMVASKRTQANTQMKDGKRQKSQTNSNQIIHIQTIAIELCAAPETAIRGLKPLIPFLNEFLQRVAKGPPKGTTSATSIQRHPNANPKANPDAGRKSKVLQFLLRILIDLERIKDAWDAFRSRNTINSPFWKYDPRVEYMLRTSAVGRAELSIEASTNTILGRYYATRSL